MPAPSNPTSVRSATVAILFAALGTVAANAADSDRIEDRLPSTARPSTEVAPASEAAADLEANYATFAPFVLQSVAIDGMTAVPRAEAEACASEYVGKTVGPIELTALMQCMTRLYRMRGLFLSRAIVPPQEVTGGVLKVRAIEGYIASVAPKGIDQADADAQFSSTLDERPANLSTFERALLLLADRYGYRVTASQLAADPNDPARYTFNVTVELMPMAWRLFGDNRGTEAHGPEQAFAWVGWNALFANADRLAASLFTTPADTQELVYGDISYARGWWNGALWTEIGASASRSHKGNAPFATAESSDVDRIYGRITVPLLRARSQSLWAGISVDARDTQEHMPPAGWTDESTRVLRGSLSYTLVDGATRHDVFLEGAHGFDAFGASANGAAHLTRADARPEFTKVRLDASVLHKFSDQWEMAISAAGQLSDGALVASEEFGGGGARFGRAYDYSEITGDRAAAAMAELRWNWRNALGVLTNLQLYAFADTVHIWNAGFAPSGWREADLSSAGGGLRASAAPGITATIEAAKPLSRDVATQGDRSPRVFVTLSLGW